MATSWGGPVLALCAYGLYSLGDASIRGIGSKLPPFELALFAATVSILISPVVLGRSARWIDLVRPNHWWHWWARGGLGIGGTLFGIYAWAHLPLAEAAAILFLGPLLTSVFVPLCLREKVPLWDWATLVGGFIGVIIVLRPGVRELQLAHFAALGCALCSAATGLLLRYTQNKEAAAAMYGASAVAVGLVGAVASIGNFVVPTGDTVWLILVFTACGAIANVLLMYAWRWGRASAVASTQYSQIIWGVALGLIFFAEVPDVPTRLGVSFILVSGVGPVLFRNLPRRHTSGAEP